VTVLLRPTLLAAFAALAAPLPVAGEGRADGRASAIEVPAGDGLADAVAHTAPGTVLHLAAGLHRGRVTITTPGLTLEGAPGAIIDGGGEGNTITVTAADATLRGLAIRGSGRSLIDKNSAVFVDRGADRAVIEDNHFEGNLIAVYLDGPRDALVRNNRIEGLRELRRNERGPAVELWNTPGSKIVGNDISDGRDGVFSVTSRENEIRGNRFRALRYAVHFMYTNRSIVADNVSVGNDIGYAVMYSDRLRLEANVSDRDREHGLLFNYANDSRIEGNVVRGSDKCVFIYNANKNRFAGNWFEGCRIGIHFTAGSERNAITGNAFVANRTQVMYVGTRSLDWAEAGRGNYWSDNPGFDLAGRGIADAAYRPNDVVDQIVWRAPAAKLLLNSPAVQILRWAQASFPAIHPGGVIDSAPLMQAPRPPALARLEEAP
jgi:nitrous oxidase accessory protein